MFILSIDIGIRNLAICLFQINHENDVYIDHWEVMSICPENIKAKDAKMVDLGIFLKKKLDVFIKNKTIDQVVIENQIGPQAIRMKSIQGMVTQYFIHQNITHIIYWSASNKLKPFLLSSEKTTYTERKKKSVQITKLLIQNFFQNQEPMFHEHKKKDDLADCFLQGIHYLMKNQLSSLPNIISNAEDLKL